MARDGFRNHDEHPTTALLVVEVAVTSRRIDARKASVYAGAKIPQYWIVDVPAGIVRVHSHPSPDGYALVTACRGDDVLDAGVDGVPATTVAALLDV